VGGGTPAGLRPAAGCSPAGCRPVCSDRSRASSAVRGLVAFLGRPFDVGAPQARHDALAARERGTAGRARPPAAVAVRNRSASATASPRRRPRSAGRDRQARGMVGERSDHRVLVRARFRPCSTRDQVVPGRHVHVPVLRAPACGMSRARRSACQPDRSSLQQRGRLMPNDSRTRSSRAGSRLRRAARCRPGGQGFGFRGGLGGLPGPSGGPSTTELTRMATRRRRRATARCWSRRW
jgi:hypothetical protein